MLALLLIAMPLKYALGYPLAVRIVGSLHGVLFLLFLVVLLRAHLEREWPLRTSLKLLLAAVLPFGFLLVDRDLKREVLAEATSK